MLVNSTPKKLLSSEKKNFLTTKYNEVNVRNGPGLNHLLLFKILHKGYPIMVIRELDNWKQVVDFEGRNGWIASSQLSSKDHRILKIMEEKIHKFPDSSSKVLAIAKKHIIFKVLKCRKKWCKIERLEIKGWVKKNSLWGGK